MLSSGSIPPLTPLQGAPRWAPASVNGEQVYMRPTEGCELFCSLALHHTPHVYDMYIHHCAILELKPANPVEGLKQEILQAWIQCRLKCPNIALQTSSDSKMLMYHPLLHQQQANDWAEETLSFSECEKIEENALLEERARLSTEEIYSKSGFFSSLHVYIEQPATLKTRMAFILRVDHAHFDATGVEVLLGILCHYLMKKKVNDTSFDGSEVQKLPPATNHLIIEDLKPKIEDHEDILEKSLGGLGGPPLGFAHSRQLPPAKWGSTHNVHFRLGTEQSNKLLQTAKEHGHTISQLQYTALVLANAAHVAERVLDPGQMSATRMSVNLRPLLRPEWGGPNGTQITMPAITPHSIVLPIGQILQRAGHLEHPANLVGDRDVFWSTAAAVAQQFRQAASLSGPLAWIVDKVVERLLAAEPMASNPSFIMVCDGISDRYTEPVVETELGRLEIPWKCLSINYGGEDETPLVNARCWAWRGKQYFGFDYNAAVLTHIEAQEILDLWKNILLLGSGVLDIAPAEETFFSSSHR